MAHPLYHALSSARQFGGEAQDYLKIHHFFDQTKMCVPSNLHRLVLHHNFGVQLCQEIHGSTLSRLSDGVCIETATIACQHIAEDFGFLPTLQECLLTHPIHTGEQRLPVLLTKDEAGVDLARKLGGQPADYQAIVAWFYRPGELLANPNFFRLLGNSFGIFLAEQGFSISITRASDSKTLPTRSIAETLVQLALGCIPTLAHFFKGMPVEAWMSRGARPLSVEFA